MKEQEKKLAIISKLEKLADDYANTCNVSKQSIIDAYLVGFTYCLKLMQNIRKNDVKAEKIESKISELQKQLDDFLKPYKDENRNVPVLSFDMIKLRGYVAKIEVLNELLTD